MDNSSDLKIDLHNKKWIFIFLSILSLLVLILFVSLFWYLISPRISSLNRYLGMGIQLIFILFILMVTGGLLLIVSTAITEKNFLFPYGEKQITLKILFPINLFLGKIFGWPKDKVRESFIEVNNSLFKATQKKIRKDRVLILLSHCIQNFDCPNKVTTNYENCQRCGKCLIDNIIELKEKYGLFLSIATGGTLARKVVVEHHPTAIVAVACERDLTSGIQDVYPIPVYGVLNQRPFGPCVNTKVDLNKLEQIIRFIQNGKL
jgi:hypothetical protein